MSIKAMKASIILGVALTVLGAAQSATAAAQITAMREYSIQRQDLGRALQRFALESGVDVAFDPAIVRGRTSQGVRGRLNAETALRMLLHGSGLGLRRTASGGFTVARLLARTGGAKGPAFMQNPAPAASARVESPIIDDRTAEEIVVTAQKREQRLIDVPLPVTAVSASELIDSNASRLQDYYRRIPGLSLATSGNGNQAVVAIRGITTGGTFVNPTVGFVIDDVPFGPSVASPAVPDIDPSNLSQIEVLRGPQGSLYGASSMGGLIKFVTLAPSTSAVSGSMNAGISAVDHSKDIGYSVRGNVNIPLGETLAIRTSGFYRLDPGYVDNVRTGKDDINKIRAKGGYASLLWIPSPTFSVQLGALIQNSRRAASDEVNLDLGATKFRQNDFPFTGEYRQRAEVYSAVVKAQLGDVDITSITAYNFSLSASKLDATLSFGGLYANLASTFFGVPTAYLPYYNRSKAYTQELRINVPLGDNSNWLLGGLIDYEDTAFGNHIDAFNTNTGVALGSIVNTVATQKYRNYALFSNVDLALGDQFSIQLGGRLSTNRQRARTVRNGPLIQASAGVPFIDSGILKSHETPFTFSISPQWKIRENLMAYARVASGYRAGGPNANCGNPSVICTYGSDSTLNYEIGLKGDFLERLITIDTSIYVIDWKDIQTLVITPDRRSAYTVNGTRARSQGVELSVGIRPARGTTIDGWIAYNDSALSEDFPAGAGLRAFDGDRLPYSSRWSGNIGANHNFAITGQLDGFFGGNLSYVGKRFGTFQGGPVRSEFPSYWQADLTAGLKWDDWRLNAYVTNLTNERGVLRSSLDSSFPYMISYTRPRSVGLGLSRTF